MRAGTRPSLIRVWVGRTRKATAVSNLRNEIGNLSAAEKFELLDALRESLEGDELRLTEGRRDELVIPWEQVQTSRKRSLGMRAFILTLALRFAPALDAAVEVTVRSPLVFQIGHSGIPRAGVRRFACMRGAIRNSGSFGAVGSELLYQPRQKAVAASASPCCKQRRKRSISSAALVERNSPGRASCGEFTAVRRSLRVRSESASDETWMRRLRESRRRIPPVCTSFCGASWDIRPWCREDSAARYL